MSAYPLLLDLTGRTVVIVGGGTVAARKAAALLAAGAVVRCVAPAFDPSLSTHVERVTGLYDGSHLTGATLVFAATNSPAVNAAVVRDARARNILVNRADIDGTDPADFTTPAAQRDGDVLLLVSAGGSPALAKTIRDDLSQKLDRRHVKMAAAMKTLRPIVLTEVPDPETRRKIFRELAREEAVNLLTVHGEEALIQWVRARYEV